MKMYFRLGLCLYLLILIASCDEVDSKSEYSVLQQVEFENRQNKLNKISIISSDTYLLVGFPSKFGDINVWILLNAKYYPYYKQMPESDFVITVEDMEEIKRIRGVSKQVVDELELRLKNQLAELE